jgi:hypothetical protein
LEPYHKKMLRERKEEKEKALREKDRWCKNHRKTPIDGAQPETSLDSVPN